MLQLTTLDIAKFWMHVQIDRNSDPLRFQSVWCGKCWLWNGDYTGSGYGRFYMDAKSFRAHRIAYLIYHGNLPEEELICHKCDNPRCVNPQHLWAGTSKENTDDMIAKGRLVREKRKRANASSKYSGVSFRKDVGKWRARIMRDYKNILIGEFATEEEAHQARERFKASLPPL